MSNHNRKRKKERLLLPHVVEGGIVQYVNNIYVYKKSLLETRVPAIFNFGACVEIQPKKFNHA